MLNLTMVALGGAIGSTLRYVMGSVGAAWLGGAFPWSTILINIMGSALIGFVGASTVPNGMLPNSPVLRAFVMVGICGGFTTFSSFSLQTLDLMRDNRLLAAGGNVLLSVVFCLAGVAAGHYGADGITLKRISRQADGALHMGAVILAILDKPDRAVPILATSRQLLDTVGGGRIEAMALRPPGSADIAATEEIVAPQATIDGHPKAEELHRLFEQWWETVGHAPAIDVGWSAPRGTASAIVTERSATCDLVVMGRSDPEDGEQRHGAIHAAIFDTHRPVLMIPHGKVAPIGRTIAIAWTDDTAIRSVLLTSMRLLEGASRVVVLVDDRRFELPSMFEQHHIRAELQPVTGDGPLGARLLTGAEEAGADLLVTGAYHHGALRERLFGGPTLHLLENANIPLLMRH